jgi:serine protease inhibitor
MARSLLVESSLVSRAILHGNTRGQQPQLLRAARRADQPFQYFIRDRDTDAVLFSGRVLDPH